MSKKSRRADRIVACELAALVMSGRGDETPVPMIWSLTVFFEEYITKGAPGTAKNFGPKKPAKLKLVGTVK